MVCHSIRGARPGFGGHLCVRRASPPAAARRGPARSAAPRSGALGRSGLGERAGWRPGARSAPARFEGHVFGARHRPAGAAARRPTGRYSQLGARGRQRADHWRRRATGQIVGPRQRAGGPNAPKTGHERGDQVFLAQGRTAGAAAACGEPQTVPCLDKSCSEGWQLAVLGFALGSSPPRRAPPAPAAPGDHAAGSPRPRAADRAEQGARPPRPRPAARAPARARRARRRPG
jgi:hypothetical protein